MFLARLLGDFLIPSKKAKSGYILIELLFMIAILASLATGIFTLNKAYQYSIGKFQLELAASIFANDIRELQSKTMFGLYPNDTTLTVTTSNKRQYSLTASNKKIKTIKYSSMGCDGIYFSSGTVSLNFNNSGTPKSIANYTLRHEKLPNTTYKTIEVQAVTGRVVITDHT